MEPVDKAFGCDYTNKSDPIPGSQKEWNPDSPEFSVDVVAVGVVERSHKVTEPNVHWSANNLCYFILCCQYDMYPQRQLIKCFHHTWKSLSPRQQTSAKILSKLLSHRSTPNPEEEILTRRR